MASGGDRVAQNFGASRVVPTRSLSGGAAQVLRAGFWVARIAASRSAGAGTIDIMRA